jgi:transcriptional regulator with XRE-family HTH domain
MQVEPEIAFGTVLREQRKKKGLSQEALALEAGIERNYVSLIELGKNSASIKMIFKLASVLNTPPSKLLEMTEEKMRHSPQ